MHAQTCDLVHITNAGADHQHLRAASMAVLHASGTQRKSSKDERIGASKAFFKCLSINLLSW